MEAHQPAEQDTTAEETIELGLPEDAAVAAESDAGVNAFAGLDPELVGIFLEEAYDLINSTASALHTWSEDPDNRQVAAELQRDVHTLKGGARMAGVAPIGDLTHVLEDLFEKVAEGQLQATPEMNDLLFACHDRLALMVEQVATQKPCPDAHELIGRVQAILAGHPTGQDQPAVESPHDAGLITLFEPVEQGEEWLSPELPQTSDDDLAGIFLDEGREIHAALTEALAQWRDDPAELIGVTQLQQELHTLRGGALLADIDPVAELAEAWSDALEPLVAGGNNQQAALALSERALGALDQMLNTLEDGGKAAPDQALIDALRALPVTVTSQTDADTGDSGAIAAAEPVDAEVIEIFLEEAGEILDQLEQLFADWRKEPGNAHFNREAQRALHTLKGGARLAQQRDLGDAAHGLETRLIDLGVIAHRKATGRPLLRIMTVSSPWWPNCAIDLPVTGPPPPASLRGGAPGRSPGRTRRASHGSPGKRTRAGGTGPTCPGRRTRHPDPSQGAGQNTAAEACRRRTRCPGDYPGIGAAAG